ncbi:MAG: hypothetical protein MR742_06815 [Clostridiales bacterium]|nr:hypothetical protein [Clostridiales bacterium]
MKVRRTIGGALFGIGCAVTFVGILATVLPMVQNDQLQLVLSSFEMPSDNVIVSAINGAMTYALHHCYGVLLCGIVMMAAGMGVLLQRSRRRPTRRRPASPYSRPASAPAAKPVWPEEDADWSAWKPRETRSNPFAGAIYEDLPSRAPSPAVPPAYTPPPILPPSNAADEPSPYARPFTQAPVPPPATEPTAPSFVTPSASEATLLPGEETSFASPPVPAPTAAPSSTPEPGASPSAPPSPPASSAPAVAPVHTEAGAPSQSGSRVMIRSTITSKAEKPAPEPVSPAPAQSTSRKVVLDGIAYEPNEPPEEETAPPPSSRIRSTMGKHTV